MSYESLLHISYKNENDYNEIYNSRINNECATLLDFEIAGNKAFFLTNQDILMLVAKIMSIDKELDHLTANLPSLALEQYTKQTLVDEIKQTNDIENVYSTKKEIQETFKKVRQGQNKGRFNGLIAKYIKLQTDDSIPLATCEDIRKLYDDLVLKEVVEDDKDNAPDGLIFRKDAVNIHSSTGKIIHEGLYPEDKIIDAMTKALGILNDKNINCLISAAIFHYLFAFIHPFYDGNGRIDRFISSYIISANLNHLTAYKFSYIIKSHQSVYYRMFTETNNPRNKGDLTAFIIKFLEFVMEAEKELITDLETKFSDYNYYQHKLTQHGFNGLEKNVTDILLQYALFGEEGVSITVIARLLNKSYNTIAKAIESIETHSNILRIEKTGNRKVYDLNLNVLN